MSRFFVMIEGPGDGLSPLLDEDSAVATLDSAKEAEDAAEENHFATSHGFKVFDIEAAY